MKLMKRVVRNEAKKVQGGFGTSTPIHVFPPPWRPKAGSFFRKLT
jgi:hypothetical protein